MSPNTSPATPPVPPSRAYVFFTFVFALMAFTFTGLAGTWLLLAWTALQSSSAQMFAGPIGFAGLALGGLGLYLAYETGVRLRVIYPRSEGVR